MTDYEKAVVLNGIAILAVYTAVILGLTAGMLFLPWWPAKVTCALIAIYTIFRTMAAYYASR